MEIKAKSMTNLWKSKENQMEIEGKSIGTHRKINENP